MQRRMHEAEPGVVCRGWHERDDLSVLREAMKNQLEIYHNDACAHSSGDSFLTHLDRSLHGRWEQVEASSLQGRELIDPLLAPELSLRAMRSDPARESEHLEVGAVFRVASCRT